MTDSEEKPNGGKLVENVWSKTRLIAPNKNLNELYKLFLFYTFSTFIFIYGCEVEYGFALGFIFRILRIPLPVNCTR